MGFDVGNFFEDAYKKALPKLETAAAEALQKEGQQLITKFAPQITGALQSNIVKYLPSGQEVTAEQKEKVDSLIASYLGITPQTAKIGIIAVGVMSFAMFSLLVFREFKR